MGIILGAAPSSDYYAIGVPHPSASFGYNPLTITHTVPSNWPSAESVGDYFIDKSHASATDTNNTYGYPDQPRLTPVDNVTLGAGNVYAFGNTSGTDDYTPIPGDSFIAITANGTQANPCFVIGDYDGDRVVLNTSDLDAGIALLSNSTHCIVEGFETFNARQVFGVTSPASYICVRDWLCDGTNITVGGNGTTMPLSGSSSSSIIDHVVFYNNTIRNIQGPFRDDSPIDFNAFTISWNNEDIWVIGNTSSQMDGDSIRIGDNHANKGSNANLIRCYVAKNDFSRNGENPLDIKECSKCVISENDFYDAIPSSGNDPGALIPIHEDAEDIYILGNRFREATVGLNITTSGSFGARRIYSMFNEYWDIYADFTADQTPSASNDIGKCINNRSTGGPVWSVNDTFQNYDVAVAASSANSEVNVVGALFASKRTVETFAYDIMWNGAGTGDELDFCCHDDVDIYINGAVYTTLASLPSTFGDNSVEGTIDFTNEGTHDFTLQATSDALGVGINSAAQAIYDQFFTDFGFKMLGTTDYPDTGQNARPAAIANWDAGANERS